MTFDYYKQFRYSARLRKKWQQTYLFVFPYIFSWLIKRLFIVGSKARRSYEDKSVYAVRSASPTICPRVSLTSQSTVTSRLQWYKTRRESIDFMHHESHLGKQNFCSGDLYMYKLYRLYSWSRHHFPRLGIYDQISNVSHTESQKLKDSRLVLYIVVVTVDCEVNDTRGQIVGLALRTAYTDLSS